MDSATFFVDNFDEFLKMPDSPSNDSLFGDSDKLFDWTQPDTVEDPVSASSDEVEEAVPPPQEILNLNAPENFDAMFWDAFAQLDKDSTSTKECEDSESLPALEAATLQILQDQQPPQLEFPPAPVPPLTVSSFSPPSPAPESTNEETRNEPDVLLSEEFPIVPASPKGKGKRRMVEEPIVKARQNMAPEQRPVKRPKMALASTGPTFPFFFGLPQTQDMQPECSSAQLQQDCWNRAAQNQKLLEAQQQKQLERLVREQILAFQQTALARSQTQLGESMPTSGGFKPQRIFEQPAQPQTGFQELSFLNELSQQQLLNQRQQCQPVSQQAFFQQLADLPLQQQQSVSGFAQQQALISALQPALKQHPTRPAPQQPRQGSILSPPRSARQLHREEVERNRLREEFLLKMHSKENQFRSDYGMPQLKWGAFKKEIAYREKKGVSPFPYSEYIPVSQCKRTTSDDGKN